MRVMCLHGTSNNGNIIRLQLTPLTRFAKTAADKGGRPLELICPDGPLMVKDDNLLREPMGKLFPGEELREWDEFASDDRGWRIAKGRLEGAVALVARLLREHAPVDGIVGFSQGANLTSVIGASITIRW